MGEPLFTIQTEPGQGNLGAKPYFASIVGPRRVALASRSRVNLNTNGSQQLVSNTGVGKGVCFVSVSLVPGVAPTLVLFGSDSGVSDNNGIPEVLSTNTTGVLKFQAILNPGDMLFASLPSTAVPGTSVGLVVSTEWY